MTFFEGLFDSMRRPEFRILFIIVILTIIMGFGIFYERIGFLLGFLLLLFGVLIITAVHHLLQVLSRGDTFGVESSLPTLDGSEGGWRLSSSLTILILIIVLTIIPIFVYNGLSENTKDQTQKETKNIPAPTDRNLHVPRTHRDSISAGLIDTTRIR